MENAEDFFWINSITEKFLTKGYIDGSSKEDIIARIFNIIETAEKYLNRPLPLVRKGVKRGWVSFASPVWSNFGTDKGLPVSCNGSFMEDSIESIIRANSEIGMMTKLGSGTSCYMGKIRSSGQKTSNGYISQGAVHFAKLLQETVSVISQSNVRRGSCCVYIDVDHDDIHNWLDMRSISDGVHHAIQHLSFGVCISDKWFNEMLEEKKGGEKRKIIAKIIRKRRSTGYPFIFFTDNVNKNKPKVLKDKNIPIYSSNLCSEIMLPCDENTSFVCNLSSVNLLYYDEWKETGFIQEMIYFLDSVLTEYIKKTENIPYMERAYNFAKKWRAIGLGVLGYHSYLQSKSIPFESDEARDVNVEIHKYIQKESLIASKEMAGIYGVPEGLEGYDMRHLCLNAIAPTSSSSVILGQVSPSIEPLESNYFENDTAKGVFTYKNKQLEKVLIKKALNTHEVWVDILRHNGSVQHVDYLNDHEKKVFKTAIEISQYELIEQAAARQAFIDQGQSLNLFISPHKTMQENYDFLYKAWKAGLKSLYYHKSQNASQELIRDNYCKHCEA